MYADEQEDPKQAAVARLEQIKRAKKTYRVTLVKRCTLARLEAL
jgi:hypothetical protein